MLLLLLLFPQPQVRARRRRPARAAAQRVPPRRAHERDRRVPAHAPLGRGSAQIARFLFGEDFEIVPRLQPDGSDLVLHRKGNPRVLDRSIGRSGLEWRFEQARQRKQRGEPQEPQG